METPTFGEKFRALLATGRVSNLPTVWSNVLVGLWMAIHLGDSDLNTFLEHAKNFEFWILGFALIASSSLYVGGCMLGDFRDLRFDRKHRPNRPLPRGVITPTTVFITAICLLGLGLIAGSIAAPVSLICALKVPLSELRGASVSNYLSLFEANQITTLGLLTALIVCYALFHKKARLLALINMASCRAALVVFSLALGSYTFFTGRDFSIDLSIITSPVLVIACGVGIYTFLLSTVAATESNNQKFPYRTMWGILMAALPFAVCLIILKLDQDITGPWWDRESFVNRLEAFAPFLIGAGLCYLSWMVFTLSALNTSKPVFVSRALAGFCLLDACFAATFSPIIACICLGLFGLALLLQKVTPAT